MKESQGLFLEIIRIDTGKENDIALAYNCILKEESHVKKTPRGGCSQGRKIF